MKRFRVCLAFLLAFFLASVSTLVSSQDAPEEPAKHQIDVWLDECMAKDPSTHGTLQCMGTAYEKWDVELNRTYKALMASLPPEGKTALKSAQVAWVKQRDEEFKFLQVLYGQMEGTMYQTCQAADRVQVVRDRVMTLQSYVDILSQR